MTSAVAVDAIQFWGSDQFKLKFTAPTGPGSIAISNVNGVAGNSYVTAVTLTQGAFPSGWLFGLDIGPVELLDQIALGAPFHGSLDAGGGSRFEIFSGVPSGVPVYAVSLQFTALGPFGGSFVNASTPEFFLTP